MAEAQDGFAATYLQKSNEVKLDLKILLTSAVHTEEELSSLASSVDALLAKLTEYMKQNEELNTNLTRLAKMEADLVAKRITEADLPQPTEYDRTF